MSDEPLTGEQLMDTLFKLQERLRKSGVERTYGIREAMGVECPYYWKSLNLFLKRDYQEVKTLVEEAKRLIDICEQEEAGCGKKEGS